MIIDGRERDMATLSAEERAKIVNELNRVAVGWSDDHTKMTKGISLTKDEFINIARAGLEKLGGNT